MIDWDLWRSIEELAFAGSYAGAAKRLKVDPTTVKRKKETMERLLGRQLFRRHSGYLIPTPACKTALDDVRVAAKHLQAAHSKLSPDIEHRSWHKIVITSLPYICDRLLAPAMGRFQTNQRFRIEIVGGERNLDLGSEREADMALRLGASSTAGVTAWHVADIDYATYISKDVSAEASPWATLDRLNWG